MDFFTNTGTGEAGFALFDAVHFAWIAAVAIFAAVLCLVHRRLSDSGRRRLQRGFCLAMFSLYLLRQLVLMLVGDYGVHYLPLHLCGMSLYIETIDSLFPNRFTRELGYAVCMPGALMGLLYANWGNLPLWNYISITSFIFHGMMIIYPLLYLTAGQHRPSPKRLPLCFGFLCAVSLPVYFFNRHFGTNYMFLAAPSAGSPLVWFEKLFGNPGYLLGFVIMIAILWAVMYLPFGLTERRKAKVSPSGDKLQED